MDYIPLEVLPAPRRLEDLCEDAKHYKGYGKHAVTDAKANVTSLDFCPTRPREIVVASGTKAEVINLKDMEVIMRISKFKDFVQSASYRHDGKLIAFADASGLVQVADCGIRKVLRRLRGHTASVSQARFNRSGVLMSGGNDKTLRMWDLAAGKSIVTVDDAHEDYIRALRPSPVSDATWVSGGYDGVIKVWDARTGDAAGINPVLSLEAGHQVEDLVIAPSGLMLYAAAGTHIQQWDLAAGRLLASDNRHAKAVTGLALGRGGDALLSTSMDNSHKIHDVTTFTVRSTFGCAAPAMCGAWSPDDVHLAVGTADGKWTLRKHKKIAEAKAPKPKPERKPRQGTIQYFKRGKDFQPAAGEATVVPGTGEQSSQVDRMLRKFEYSAVLDLATSWSKPEIAFAVIDELTQQGALEVAVDNRSHEELGRLLRWAGKHISSDPCYKPVLLELLHLLIEQAAELPVTPELQKALHQVDQQIQLAIIGVSHQTPLLGALDLVMSH